METRVEQFLQDAQRLSQAQDSGKHAKEMTKLRTFLFKNQDYRFTDREQAHLFQAVQVHATTATSALAGATTAPNETVHDAALALIEDALKMPFNVFGTSHKKAFLKWHAKLTGQDDCASNAASGNSSRRRLQVIDMQDGKVTLMSQEGDTFEVLVSNKGQELASRLQKLFDQGEDVVVEVEGSSDQGLQLLDIVGQ